MVITPDIAAHNAAIEWEFYTKYPEDRDVILAQYRIAGLGPDSQPQFYTVYDEYGQLWGWNVSLAKFLVKAKCVPVDQLDLALAEKIILRPSQDLRASIDTEYASKIDLDKAGPAIAVLHRNKPDEEAGAMLIDGLHRLYRARQLGRDSYPVHVLSEEDGLACRLPPHAVEMFAKMK